MPDALGETCVNASSDRGSTPLASTNQALIIKIESKKSLTTPMEL